MVMIRGCDLTQDFDICNCRCHSSDFVRHIVACCWGMCLHCHRYIHFGSVASHMEKCTSKSDPDTENSKE